MKSILLLCLFMTGCAANVSGTVDHPTASRDPSAYSLAHLQAAEKLSQREDELLQQRANTIYATDSERRQAEDALEKIHLQVWEELTKAGNQGGE